MIYKFQPFSPTKQLGVEYNSHCQLVPNDNDWVLILDWDCMLLLHSQYELMERAIKLYPDTDIFGAWTNRVGYAHQRLDNVIGFDIKEHIKTAQYMLSLWPMGQCHDAPSLAGFFLLFKKSYWLNNKFQDKIINDVGKCFDKVFCSGAKTMRIISGLYVFHQYRAMQENMRDRSHLR